MISPSSVSAIKTCNQTKLRGETDIGIKGLDIRLAVK
jgi:hypothetical protein